jgi:hypothetical protein
MATPNVTENTISPRCTSGMIVEDTDDVSRLTKTTGAPGYVPHIRQARCRYPASQVKSISLLAAKLYGTSLREVEATFIKRHSDREYIQH